jgi:glutamate synthase domain-containing protein 3
LDDAAEIEEVRRLVERHVQYTQSRRGQALLLDWRTTVERLVRVVPKDYRRVREAILRAKQAGLSETDAVMAAFETGLVGVSSN